MKIYYLPIFDEIVWVVNGKFYGRERWMTYFYDNDVDKEFLGTI